MSPRQPLENDTYAGLGSFKPEMEVPEMSRPGPLGRSIAPESGHMTPDKVPQLQNPLGPAAKAQRFPKPYGRIY